MNTRAARPTTGMLLVEARYGVGIRSMLVQLYHRHSSMQEIADELGFSRQTVYNWMKVLGMDLDGLKLEAVAYQTGIEPRQMLLDVWREYRSIRRASRHLGIPQNSARRWFNKAGITAQELDSDPAQDGGESAQTTASV